MTFDITVTNLYCIPHLGSSVKSSNVYLLHTSKHGVSRRASEALFPLPNGNHHVAG